jgi:protein-disulfide isomerase
MMRLHWERASSLVLTCTAVVIAGAVIHREFVATSAGVGKDAKPYYDANWRLALSVGRASGPVDAPIAVVEFSDYECPFCARFHATLRGVQQAHPGRIRHYLVHFPSPRHQYALRAARAAECAAKIDKFAEASDLLFRHQKALGDSLWPWFRVATNGSDSTRLASCLAEDTFPLGTVDSSLALGRSMRVLGTPTVFLNGWRYPGAPPDSEFVRAVTDLLAGRRPYRGFPKTSIDVTRALRETR